MTLQCLQSGVQYISRRSGDLVLSALPALLALTTVVAPPGATQAYADALEAMSCYSLDDKQDGAQRQYLLSAGDQLQILVYQREDLSGAREIGEDGMISLPLLGRLKAASIGLAELESMIAEAIEKTTGRTENVSVQLAARRPIFVLGLVNRPGSYAFLSDMMVLHAVALGGGLFRPAGGANGVIGVTRENARIGESTLRLKQNLALQARLKAELDAEPDVSPPKRLIAMEGDDGARQLMNRQTRIMKKRTKLREEQIVGLRKTAELTRKEIESLIAREKLTVDQIELAKEELGAANALKKKGLVRRSDLFTIHRVVAGLRADRRAVQGRIVAAERRLLEIEERVQLFDVTQDLGIEQELNQAEINIAATEAAIRSSQWIVGELNTLSQDSSNENKAITIKYQVIRSTGKRRHQFTAEELTPLCPGDIVRVQPALIK